jgi:periplasmic mercuric ion binding protein
MKSIKYILVAILAVAFTTQLNAAKAVQTASIKVNGKCGLCKTRIEKAAKLAGVTTADWNEATKTLKITFDGSKTNVDKVSKAIAAVGHDTEKYKADAKTYNALPACCKYERSK